MADAAWRKFFQSFNLFSIPPKDCDMLYGDLNDILVE